MRSLSKNVKKDPHEYVYQGSKNNENKGLEKINMRSLSKNVKKTLRKTFYREKKKWKLKNENKG